MVRFSECTILLLVTLVTPMPALTRQGYLLKLLKIST